MLFPEQVVPFLQHVDPIVRDHAQLYFRNSYNFGPLTSDHYWAVIDRYGENDRTLGIAADLGALPQTDSSLRRLIEKLGGTSSELFEFQYQHAARNMELSVLERNRAEFLACPQLLPHVRKHLEMRLNLLEQTPAEAWDRLMQHGRELGNEYVGQFNSSESDALIEAAARGGAAICEQAVLMLEDESATADWREIFAVRVLGRARYEPAIDALVKKFAIDTDILREDVSRALARIATPRVVESIVDFYPGKPWHVRLYAHGPIVHIKLPQSEEGLLKLLGLELALDADPKYDDEGSPLIDSVLIDLAQLGSLAGLEESRKFITRFPQDPEALDLCECLLATAVMWGTTLPEEAAWRTEAKKVNDRVSAARADFGEMFGRMRDQWRKTGVNFAPAAETKVDRTFSEAIPLRSLPDPSDVRPEPIRNTAPKVGRNDPCPCGSNKKYKKCCGK